MFSIRNVVVHTCLSYQSSSMMKGLKVATQLFKDNRLIEGCPFANK